MKSHGKHNGPSNLKHIQSHGIPWDKNIYCTTPDSTPPPHKLTFHFDTARFNAAVFGRVARGGAVVVREHKIEVVVGEVRVVVRVAAIFAIVAVVGLDNNINGRKVGCQAQDLAQCALGVVDGPVRAAGAGDRGTEVVDFLFAPFGNWSGKGVAEMQAFTYWKQDLVGMYHMYIGHEPPVAYFRQLLRDNSDVSQHQPRCCSQYLIRTTCSSIPRLLAV